jgi:hypothetical protein
MTQPSRILYLPPGVATSSATVAPVGAPPAAITIPFDRVFFEKLLPQAVANFCKQVPGCDAPVVEVLTVDGMTHFVRGISGVTDAWVALHTRQDHHDHDIQVFVPYTTIYRVAIHPVDEPQRGRLGFLLG